MKTKIRLLLFVIVVSIGAGVGGWSIYRGLDVIESGEECLLETTDISNIYHYQKRRGSLRFSYASNFSIPYNNDIAHINKRIVEKKNKQRYCVSMAEEEFILTLERDSRGVLRAKEYAKKMSPMPNLFCWANVNSYRYEINKDKKYIALEKPTLEFYAKNCSKSLSYSKKGMENLEAYINKLPKDKRETFLVVRLKDGMFVAVDALVNGVSLNAVASGAKIQPNVESQKK